MPPRRGDARDGFGIDLPPAPPRSGLSDAARQALRQLRDDEERRLSAAFRADLDAGRTIRARALVTERIVAHVWQACVGEAGEVALLATGGFGRGVLFAQSDVDLLVLAEADARARHARAIAAFFRALWDIGLMPAEAVRTPDEQRAWVASDLTTFTAMLESRRMAGEGIGVDHSAIPGSDEEPWPSQRFLVAKRQEQALRHARFDDTAFNLEPNVKEGPGGLRQIDLVRWCALRVAGTGDWNAMRAQGWIDAGEQDEWERAEALLQRFREGLHLVAGRREDRLLFDHQRALAEWFGYRDVHAKNLAVEQCMQGFYGAAATTRRLGDQLLERLAERLEPHPGPREPIDSRFVRRGSRIGLVDARHFQREPAAAIALFALPLDHADVAGPDADTIRALHAAAFDQGARLAADAGARAAFLALLRRGVAAVPALVAMNRHGLLAAMLPGFGAVVGRMQFDLFHAYTVDEHTVRVLGHLARFADREANAAFPHAHDILTAIDRTERLLLAALFHDIAKGRGGDHSELGAIEARAFCSQLGLPAADVDTVAWLVQRHLLMSTTAQRQDIGDPHVIHRFASEVGSRERLDLLYLLTLADIAGTHPRLWNAWKAQLLADLHEAARYALRAGRVEPVDAPARIAQHRRLVGEQLASGMLDTAGIDSCLTVLPDALFLRERPERIAFQVRAWMQATSSTVVAFDADDGRGGSHLFVRTRDREGVFAAIVATLDRHGCTVVAARLVKADDGFVHESFDVLDAESALPLTAASAAALVAELRRVLAVRKPSQRLVRRRMPRPLRHFQRPPRIAFDQIGGLTQMALVASDRPGLLVEVAQILREARVRLHDARIATFGERVEDFFLLSDAGGAALDDNACQALADALARCLSVS